MQIVGSIDNRVIELLKLSQPIDKTIYIGSTNEKHMRSKHPNDYKKYNHKIPLILSNPDYVGINRKDNSIEYIKEFKIDNEYVKVAVRVSANNRYFVRSLYVVNSNRVANFIKKKTLLKY